MGFDASFVCVRKDYRRSVNKLLKPPGRDERAHGVVGGRADHVGPRPGDRVHEGLDGAGRPAGVRGRREPAAEAAEGHVWPTRIAAGLARLSKDALTFGFMLWEDVRVHGFTVHRDGGRRRCRLVHGAKVIHDVGRPTPEEKRARAVEADDDEHDLLFQIMREYGIPPADLAAVEFTFLSSAEG